MKKPFLPLSLFAFCSFALSMLVACGQAQSSVSAPAIVSYRLSNQGELIAVYDNQSEVNLGNWNEDIVKSLREVTVSEDGYFIINGITTKINADPALVKYISQITISSDGYYVVNGVKTGISAVEVHTVEFTTGFGETIPSQRIKDGNKVERPSLSRTGYTLQGWYCNNEEWRFNTDLVKNDMNLIALWKANQYTVSFVNEKGENPQDIVVTFEQDAVLPEVEKAAGYSFEGWFMDSTKIENGKWSIAKDVTLVAKWVANRHTITLDPKGGSVSTEAVEVTYGQPFVLPVPSNTEGAFVGWLYDGRAITDSSGSSLKNWSIDKDITAYVDWIIHLSSVTDLAKMELFPKGKFVLDNDIDLKGISWRPLCSETAPFEGFLDGKGHSIKNLRIDTSSASASTLSSFGLFGYASKGTISNLALESVEFESENIDSAYAVGAFVGKQMPDSHLTFNKCAVDGSFNLSKQSSVKLVEAGGFVGAANSVSFVDCSSEVSIVNAFYSGGFAGYTQTIICSGSQNRGTVSATFASGGFAGYAKSSALSQCKNEGTISSSSAAGGLIGKTAAGSAEYCCNIGNVSSSDNGNVNAGAGGLFGSGYDESVSYGSGTLTISNSYNAGTISAGYCGGLAGFAETINASDCYNSGSVIGTGSAAYVGGIAPSALTVNIRECYSAGDVTGNIIRSPICYKLAGGTITDCFFSPSESSFNSIQGTHVEATFDSSFFIGQMYWSEYDAVSKKGFWLFHNDRYPTLFWEN